MSTKRIWTVNLYDQRYGNRWWATSSTRPKAYRLALRLAREFYGTPSIFFDDQFKTLMKDWRNNTQRSSMASPQGYCVEIIRGRP